MKSLVIENSSIQKFLHAESISAPVSSPNDVTYSIAAEGSVAYSYNEIDTCQPGCNHRVDM